MGMESTNMVGVLVLVLAMAYPVRNAQATNSVVLPNNQLTSEEMLVEGQYQFRMQSDCNLVLYRGYQPIWASGTDGRGYNSFFIMQSDGNAVVYTSDGDPVFAIDSNDRYDGDHYIILQCDVDMYNNNGCRLWAIHCMVGVLVLVLAVAYPVRNAQATNSVVLPINQLTSEQRQYQFRMQSNCNLVLYRDYQHIWASGTDGRGCNCFFIMQSDDNAAVYTATVTLSSPPLRWRPLPHVHILSGPPIP